MNWIRTLRSWLVRFAALFAKQRRDRELATEIESNLELHIQDNLRVGMTPHEARRQALIKLGGVESAKESYRERRGIPFLETFWQDVRFAVRMLRKSPGFTLVAILTLALGVGANTAIFSIVDSLLLRPLPVSDPNRISVLAFRQGNGPLLTQFSVPDYGDIRTQASNVFSGLIAFQLSFDGVGIEGHADRALTAYVTGNFFSVLGLKPFLGRFIVPSEGQTPGADPVIVLSYSCWESRFGSDRSIVGKRVRVNGHPATVVGVAPPGFNGLYPAPGVQAYFPLAMVTSFEQGWPADWMSSRILQNLYVVGRLRPDASLANAGATLHVIAHRLSAQYPETDKGMALSVYFERYARPDPGTAGTVIKSAALFLALVVLVLLLACANIANLLLVRATTRGREMAVRAALGAPRSRLIRQLLTESLLLAVIGGLVGMVVGLWGARAISLVNLHQPVDIPLLAGLDWRIFAYSLGIALFTGVLAGLLPALRASRTRINATLHESGRSVIAGKSPWRTALVAAQVAGSLMLLVIAGLFTRSLGAVQHVDLGFQPQHMVVLTMDPTEVGFNEAQGLAFYNSLLERIRALPGIQSAALTSNRPLSNFQAADYLKVSDYQNPPGQGLPLVNYGVVSSGFFHAMRIPILHGRAFNDADTNGAPYVAIVSDAFARRFWPNQNPIGKRFAKLSGATNPLYEVVGVAQDARFLDLSGPTDAYFYLPLGQDYALSSLQTLAIRSSAPLDAVIREAEGVVHDLAANLPVFGVETMDESLDTLSGFLLFQLGAGFAAVLGLLGLVLAIVGVYGVISYSTGQRTHEIGIRVALGAQRSQVLGLILRQGFLIVGAGLLAGCVGALIVARLVASLLVGVGPSDPVTYVGVTAVLALIAFVACYIPARRAMLVDPIAALRHE